MLNTRPSVFHTFKQEVSALQSEFKHAIEINASMAKYSSARTGGKADILINTSNAVELARVVSRLWEFNIPFMVLGGCSNILVSDKGIRGVVVLNRARGLTNVEFDLQSDPPRVNADTAVNLGLLARTAAQKGLSGLEWAAGIPGTLGGAIVGNAGAHGSDMASNLFVADILQRSTGKQAQLPVRSSWSNREFKFGYRTSILKKMRGDAVVLNAELHVCKGDPEKIQQKLQELVAIRRKTQPPGATMGSMFKNPPGGYAGQLIEQAGLKGAQVGKAQISTLHANFFVNLGGANAADIYRLIKLAQDKVFENSGIKLGLEIELIGEWEPMTSQA